MVLLPPWCVVSCVVSCVVLTQVDHIALSEASRDVVTAELTRFLSPKGPMVLIISYETFRIHCNRFYVRGPPSWVYRWQQDALPHCLPPVEFLVSALHRKRVFCVHACVCGAMQGKEGACDLMICDEAHRLKNEKTLTTQARPRNWFPLPLCRPCDVPSGRVYAWPLRALYLRRHPSVSYLRCCAVISAAKLCTPRSAVGHAHAKRPGGVLCHGGLHQPRHSWHTG